MDPILVLLLETDSVLPVSFDLGGRVHLYDDHDQSRIWLYFHTDGQRVDAGLRYKQAWSRGDDYFYGNFFQGLADGRKAEIAYQDAPYFDLLRNAAITDKIRDFYVATTGDEQVPVRTVFVFAESIPYPSRRLFLTELEHAGFLAVSYSASLTAMLSNHLAGKILRLHAEFGNTLLFLTSSGESIRLTHAIFDGENWYADDQNESIDAVGDEPLKQSFIRYVVSLANHATGYLTQESDLAREYEFQMPHADRWLALPKDAEGSFTIRDFEFSVNPGVKMNVRVEGRALETQRRVAMEGIVGQILAYRQRLEALNIVVYSGSAFREEKLVEIIQRRLGNPDYLILSDQQLAEALSGAAVPDQAESLEDFDVLEKRNQSQALRLRSWTASAVRLRDLRVRMKEILPRLQEAVEGDASRVEQMVELSRNELRSSHFPEALSVLGRDPVPGIEVRDAIKNASELLRLHGTFTHIYDDVRDLSGAQVVVGDIAKLATGLNREIERSVSLGGVLEEQKKKVRSLEADYPRYLELKRAFNLSANRGEKRDLIKQMAALTEERLPDITIPQVRVTLSAKVEERRSCLFSRSRHRTLKMAFRVEEGASLPCPAVLIVSNMMQNAACSDGPGRVVFPIPARTTSYEKELPLPHPSLNESFGLKVFLFPAPDVLDQNAILAPYINI